MERSAKRQVDSPSSRAPAIALVGALTFTLIGLANGSFKPLVFDWSRAAFWVLDVLHFVVVPLVTVVALVVSGRVALSELGLVPLRSVRDVLVTVVLCVVAYFLFSGCVFQR